MRVGPAVRIVLICAAFFGGEAAAQTLNQQRCLDRDPDISITACSAIIEAAQETPENLAVAFNNRGVAYDVKGQPDRAIDDFDEAVRLNPNFPEAFNGRGVAVPPQGPTGPGHR